MSSRGVARSIVGLVALLMAGCGGEVEPEVAGVALEEGGHALVLGDVVSDLGVSHRFEDDGVEVGSGQVLESGEVTRHLVADVLLDGDRARCEVSLHAPGDRGLVADGHLEVEVVLEARDGTVRRFEVATFDLDVTLAAGEATRLPPTASVDVDATQLRALWCEARHR